MIIEIAGIDGSGKSTLVSHLQGFFSTHDVQCVERVLRSTYKRILADVARDHGHGHWRHMFAVEEVELAHALEMGNLLATTVLPLDHSYQVVVTDTYVHRWLATAHMWGAANLERLAAIFRRMPAPDLSFRLEVDPAVAYQRLVDRPKRDHLVKVGNPDRVAAYARSFEATKSFLHYPQHVLSTATPLETTVKQLLDTVRDWDASTLHLIRQEVEF